MDDKDQAGREGGDSCAGCGRPLVTGEVEFGVERRGLYHYRCASGIPADATIESVGVYVEARHLARMPGSARRRLERARLLVPSLVARLVAAGKVDGAA